MLLRYVTPLLGILGAIPQVAAAQALQIPATESVALPRKDVGDGLCATVVHAADPRLGQVAFSGVDDANALLNQTSMRLNEDGRTGSLFSLINFRNNDPVALGDFPSDILLPYSDNPGATPPGNDRNFAVRVRGYINVDAADALGLRRTIGLYADDGTRMTLGNQLVTDPDVNQQIASRRIRQIQYGKSGLYPVELVYYQNGSLAVLELSETNQWIPENTKLTNLRDLGFSLIGEPRPNLFVNTELYSARKGAVQKCVECADDSVCGQGNYCVKDWGPTPPSGLCQQCNVNEHCGPSCQACAQSAPICLDGGCVQCLGNSDCPADNLCDTATHKCTPIIHNWEYVGGCSTANPSPGSHNGLLFATGAALLTLLGLSRRRRRPFGSGTLALPLLLSLTALWPQAARADLSVNAATLQPAIGPENIITVEGSRTGKRLRPMAALMLDYAHRPLRLLDRETGQTIATTIPDMVNLHLMAGLGVTRWLQFAFDLPVVAYQGFDRATPLSDVPNTPSAYGLGDFRLVGKARLINNEHGGFGLAFVPQVTFATGDGTQFRGADAYGIEPRFALDYRTPGGALIAVNVGFLGRTSNQTVGKMEVGSQIRYGIGMFVPLPEQFGLMGEIAGGTSVTNITAGRIYSPLEGLVGGRWTHSSGINFNMGAGMGFTEAVGSPQVRVFASIGYLPIERPQRVQPPTMGTILIEKAGSGAGSVVSTPRGIDCGQRCSADFKLGSQVALKAQATGDARFIGWSGPCSGTEDCILTVTPSTRVGVEFARVEEHRSILTIVKEGDGQGEVISDPSGISCGKVCSTSFKDNQELRLIAVPDKDSRFAGWEGACTGVEPCTLVVRGEPHLSAKFIKSKIKVDDKKLDLQGNVIHFETAKAKIDIDSFHLLDEVVLILKQYPEMRLRIEGHTDAVPFNAPGGNLQLSKDRAASVVNYLVTHGILGGRLNNQGFGDTCPVATNQSPEGRQANRRTEFLIIDKDGHYQRTPCVTYTPAPRTQWPKKPGGVKVKKPAAPVPAPAIPAQ